MTENDQEGKTITPPPNFNSKIDVICPICIGKKMRIYSMTLMEHAETREPLYWKLIYKCDCKTDLQINVGFKQQSTTKSDENPSEKKPKKTDVGLGKWAEKKP